MKKIFKSILCSSLSLLALSVVDNSYANSVEVKTNGIRRVASALVNGKPMVYVSEIDGAVSLNSLDGKQIWRIPSDNPAVMFKIISEDIDGDKNSDLLAVSANGSVYAFTSKGKLLWKYSTPEKVRLCQIATIGKGKDMRIFAGGNDYTLYELNAKGEQLSATKIRGSVHSIVSGDFIEDGKEVLLVYTLSHDKFRSDFFGFIDPVTKKVIKETKIEKPCPMGSFMVNDVTVADVNEDGRDDVLVTGHAKVGYTFAVDGDFNTLLTLKSSGQSQRYAHAFAEALMPVRKEIVMQYGGVIDVYDLKGKTVKSYGKAHGGVIYNDLECVAEAKMLVGGVR